MHGKVNHIELYRDFIYKLHFFLNCAHAYRYPDDRPNIIELQSHPFFKQIKRTTLAENLSLTGIDKYNCTKLSSGKKKNRINFDY